MAISRYHMYDSVSILITDVAQWVSTEFFDEVFHIFKIAISTREQYVFFVFVAGYAGHYGC